ncbi:IS110 family transposase [Kocuria oceani]|uniref:IS110 family transposase n=1 Tax=Kocuria oceani TaxID=988827 RepID=UPI0040360A2C
MTPGVTTLRPAGKAVYDKAPPNDEARLPAILEGLAAGHGPMLMVVDQPATIRALPVAVAQAMEAVVVAYLPGLAVRRIADMHPGTAKTDARDVLIIAEAVGKDFADAGHLASYAGIDPVTRRSGGGASMVFVKRPGPPVTGFEARWGRGRGCRRAASRTARRSVGGPER